MFTFDYARFGRAQDATYHGRFNFGMPFYLMTFPLNGAVGIDLVSTIPGLGPLSEVSVTLALLKLMGVWKGAVNFMDMILTSTIVTTRSRDGQADR